MYVLWLDVTGTTTVLSDYPRDVFDHISLHSRIRFMWDLLLLSFDCQQLHLHLNHKPHVPAYTASRGTNLKFEVSSAKVPLMMTQNILTVRWESEIDVKQT